MTQTTEQPSLPILGELSVFLNRLDREIATEEEQRAWTAQEAERLEEFADRYLWILDKEKHTRRLVLNAAQQDYLTNRTRRDLILKSRQLGFSTLIQADFLRMAVTTAVSTMTLSHDDDSTQRLRRMADFYYDNLPDGKPKRRYANASVSTYPGTNSEAAIAKAGSKNIGRSFTLTHLHGSEVAFWPDAEQILAGAMQAGNPAIVLESTPNGAQGYFYNECMDALDGHSRYKLHFYPWWWDAEYQLPIPDGEFRLTEEEAELSRKHGLTAEQIQWRRVKQRDLKHLFKQEYPEDPVTCFLLSGDGYFGDISAVRKVEPGSVEPDPDHVYVAGLDFAQTQDFFSLSVVDWTAGIEVELLRLQHLPWKEMRRRAIERMKYWGVTLCAPEKNSMGTTNIEDMQSEIGEAEASITLSPFKTDNKTKADVMSNLHTAMHEGHLAVLNDPIRIKELRQFQASQTKTGVWQLSAPENEHDDTVISLALAWDAGRELGRHGGIFV